MSVRELLIAFQRGDLTRDELRLRLQQQSAADLPLSQGQQGLWMLQSVEPDSCAYNIPICLRLSGPLDESALKSACLELLRVHGQLASAIVERDGRPQRKPLAPDTLPFAVHAAGHLSDAQIAQAMSARLQTPFALEQGPFMRVDLYAQGRDTWWLLIVVHHIAFDGGSVDAFMHTLCSSYERAADRSPDRPTLTIADSARGFDEFVAWERDFIASDAGERARQYWLRQLHGAGAALNLGSDSGGAGNARTVRHALDAATSQAIRDRCTRLQITPAAWFLSMYQQLLASVSGRDDISVGMAVDRRPHEGFDATVGCFVNLVVVRNRHDAAAALDDRLRDTHAAMAQALAHADYPFQRVARELRQRGQDQGELFDTVFEYKSRRFFALQTLQREWAGVRFEPVEGLYQQGEYPLAFKVAERESGYVLYFDHDARRLPEATADAWLQRLARSIETAVSAPSLRTDPIDATTREPARWQALHQLIQAQCRRHPQALAAVDETRSLSYGELDARSDAIAARLRRAGIGADRIVALLLEPSTDALCALLGVWKAGAAYLALDPELPAERLRFMIEDAGPSALITRDGLRDRLPCAVDALIVMEQVAAVDAPADALTASVIEPGQLAYIIYTSGSTGTPKGVALTHAGLANLARTQADAFGVAPGDRVLQFAPWTFDASVWEMSMALQAGATLHIAPTGSLRRSGLLASLMQDQRITVATLPPSALTLLDAVDLPHLRTLIVAGEECSPELAGRWMHRCRFVNAYGPTETTVCATFKWCDPQAPGVAGDIAIVPGSVPIGSAVAQTQTFVLDPRTLQQVAAGEVGELFVGGAALARGYLHRAGLTAQRFMANPFGPPGARMYRTGDRVRVLADGQLQFVGRADAQVKVRGSRVELGEIEAVAQSHPGVAQCAVVLLEERNQLAAFVVASGRGAAPDAQSLRRYIGERLPDYMVPARVHFETQLPTNANGKVDRGALASRRHGTGFKELPVMVRDRDIESTVRSIMAEVLRLDQVPLDEGFFELGGDSILAVGLARRIAAEFAIAFDVTALLNFASARRISEHVVAVRTATGPSGASDLAADAHTQQAPRETAPSYLDDCVAIIGMSCHLPGARDHRQFWDNLRNGVESVEFLSVASLRASGVPDELLSKPGLVAARSIIDDKDCFDAEFFHVSAQDAQAMDPQLRLLLQHAWKAVEDAGYRASAIADAGVFMTAANTGYHADAPPPAWTVMEGSKQYVASAWSQFGAIPTLISHRLGLHGPSLFIHSNCSSSLVALHAACRSVVAGDARHALVGAATLSASDTLGYVAEHGMNFSSDGHLRPFDAAADGMLGGEGVAVLLLKRASEAIADNDPIYALIRGVAVNNDGADKAGYYAPSVAGQARVIDKVLRDTGVDVESIDYIEAHGTATKLGDPLELAALGEAFGRHTQRRQFCGIGSVKSNVGHLDTVAGLVGCIKVALSLRHGEIPPSLNYVRPNPAIDFAASPFYVVDANLKLPLREVPHRAGVSSFGIGGTNAHALLEEFRAHAVAERPSLRWLVPLSARKPERLRAYAVDLLEFLERNGDLALGDIAHTLQVGREAFDCRLAIEASSVQELCDGLRSFIAAGAISDRAADSTALDHEELARLLPHWAERGQWQKIAAAWMRGAEIDWTALHSGSNAARRISLPTYPFAPSKYRRRSAAVESNPVASIPASATTLHPLLHRNTSSLAEHRYTTVFNGEEFVFTDHDVRGKRLLPGVAYLEMARAALAQATRSADARIVLSNVDWLRPLIAGPGATTVHVRIERRDNATYSFEIYSELSDASHCLHCQGTAALAIDSPPQRLDIEALRAMRGDTVSGEACYALFDRLGCRYGRSLRALVETGSGEAHDGARFALGRLQLAADAERDPRFVLHPGLLDSALQASIGLGLDGPSLDGAQLEQTLPFSIDRVRIEHAPGERAWVHVREAAGSSERVSKVDVRICDESGRIAVAIEGLSARVVSDAAADVAAVAVASSVPEPIEHTAAADPALGAIALVPVWDCLGPPDAPTASNDARRVLLVGPGEALRASLPRAYADAQVRELDSRHRQDEAIALIRAFQPTHVVWIAPGADTAEEPDAQVLHCLRLTKALLGEGYETRPLHFSAITTRALAVRSEEAGHPAQAAVHGFFGSLAKEYPHWAVHTLDLDEAADCPWSMLLDAPPDPENSSIALREGCRYERRLVPASVSVPTRSRIVEGGVYVVLGGAGGLGRAWTEYVLRTYRANVVWLGRSAPDGDIAQAVQALSGLGGSLRYLRVDARRRAELEAALKQIEAEHSVIHGFIHSALSLHDRGVMAVEEASFADALSSKIGTSASLVAALARYRPADFVLFFSALQSFNPSPGQSSYAAGSAFVDATAIWLRRSGQAAARVINWGYWGSVGIVASPEHRRRMAHIGEGSIEPAEAMAFIESALSGPFDQLALLKRSAPHGGAALPIAGDERIQVAPAAASMRFALPDPWLSVDTPDAPDTAMSQGPDELDTALASGLFFQIAKFAGGSDAVSLASLQARLAKPALYGRWLRETMSVLCRAGYLREIGGDAFAFERSPMEADWSLAERYFARVHGDESERAHADLVAPMLRELPQILAGRREATELMFSNASLQRVEDVYKKNPFITYFNQAVAALVQAYVEQRLRAQPNARLRLLEIGAGTGATSAQVFQALQPFAESVDEYRYTDVSRAFLGHAEREYRAQAPYLRGSIVDIDRPLHEQGIDCGSYDIVIATNVLHATGDIHRTVRHAKGGLGRNGLLIVNEMLGHELFAHLTFGLLPGWWAYRDGWLREPGSPGLAPATWQRVLKEEGFRSIRFPVAHAHRFGQQIIIAESDGVFRHKSTAVQASRADNPIAATAEASPGPVLNSSTAVASDHAPSAAPALAPEPAGPSARDQMLRYVRRLVAEALELSIEDIDADEPFESYGIDSILAIRLANALRVRFKDVSSTVIFEHSSAVALATYLLSIETPAAREPVAPAPPVTADTVPPSHPPSQHLSATATTRPSPHRDTDAADLRAAVIAHVRTIVARTLEQPVDEIDVHEPLENYGVDSILAIRIANELRGVFHEVSSTVLFEHRTVVAIAEHFIATQIDQARSLLPPTSSTSPRGATSVAATAYAPAVRSEAMAAPASQPAPARAEPHIQDQHTSERPADRPPTEQPPPSQASTSEPRASEDRAIAVIGLSGRYPQAANVDEFWHRLSRGQDCVTEIPAERWPLEGFFESDPAKAIAEGRSYSKWGGFLDGFADFDPLFFGIAPREAMAIDPHERLFLQETWRAFEDAGYTRASLASRHDRRVGVFAGISQSGFERCASGQDMAGDAIHPQTSFGSVANRVSFLLDLQGPSMPIDTMCSSSLTAIHEACEHLLREECEVAVAGGVNLNLHPSRYVASCEGRFLSTSGRCKSFGEGGDGFVPGEGVGVLILKRLSRAIADGDPIHGVIRATGINHGGRAKGYTAPNPAAQRELVKATLRKAGLSARDITNVEAHGTGTELGDPIEIDALTQAFRESTDERGFCAIGSVKSNIGHLEAAAGVAGVTKVLLQLRHRQLAPSLHAQQLNPHIAFDAGPFRLQRELAAWPAPAGTRAGKRIASVSSFGAGGANAHVIIEEYAAPTNEPVAMPGPFLVLLSAKDEDRLRECAARLLDACRKLDERLLADVAYTLQVAREPMDVRMGCVVRTMAQLEDKLERFVQQRKDIDDLHTGDARRNRKTLSWLREDDDTRTLVETWLARGKHERLLEAWVNGAAQIDWELLYPQARPRRLSLPTYPFAPERYWISDSAPAVSPPAGASATDGALARTLHPLVHRNTSTLTQTRFTSTFSGNEPIFADHIVAGQRILPAVAYLEMARASAALASPAATAVSMQISEAVWLKPVVMRSPSLDLHIYLSQHGDDEIVCEFVCEAGEGEDLASARHAPCARVRVRLQAEIAPASLDIAALRANTSAAPTQGDACYRELSAIGVEYGPSHRGLVELQPGQDALGRYVLARLRLPTVARADADRLALHPSLLDSALQAAGFDSGDGAQDDAPRAASVPFALDGLQLFRPCPSECWAVVRRAPPTSGVVRTHIDLCDDAGQVCVRLQGLSGRTYRHGAAKPAHVAVEHKTLVFVPASPRSLASLPQLADSRRVLVACELPASALAAFEPSVQCKLLESAAMDPAERFAAYAEQLLEIVRSLRQDGASTSTLLQLAVPQRGTGRLHAALAALLRSAQAESPGLTTQLLALDLDGTAIASAEIVRSDELREIELPALDAETPVWRERGVYLVTGGLGGIGSTVVADIARGRPGATIVIAGRSELSPTQRDHLRQLGARIEYRCMDVSHRPQVEELIAEILAQFGALHGVLHCAGSAHSRLLTGLASAELAQALAAKVAGTRNLDLATRHLPLDLFVLFSSLSARTGAIGQGAYATANAFMDEYAQYRHALRGMGERSGRSLSIGWPHWSTDGGMQLTADVLDEMQRHGFQAMSAQTGLNVLQRALAVDYPQLAVVHGDAAKIRAAFAVAGVAADRVEPAPQPRPAAAPADEAQLAQAIKALREFLGEQLMIAPARIHANDTFDAFGIDSVVAVRLTAALEKTHGALSKTLFFEHATVADMASYLASRAPAVAVRATQPDAIQARDDAGATGTVNDAIANAVAENVVAMDVATTNPPRAIESSPARGHDAIAIIGLAGRYPRSATLEAFWDNLKAGADCISEIPADRWELEGFFDPQPGVPGRSYSKWGGFIDGVADFDPKFFNISPREAPMMDPQERLFLMCAHDALEDAGYTRESLNLGAQAGVGVFVGVMHTEYQLFGAQAQIQGEPLVLGSGISSVANRVSYFGNFQGPSLAVDTMCSSSLTAIHLACQSLRDGDCDAAIAGGVNVSLHPNKYLGLSQAKFASSDGRCVAFGDGGDGYVPGEGVGAVLLKPLAAAIADGDRIYAVIKGSGINHGGRSNGFTVPSASAQARLIERVIERSGVDARRIGYLEAHGTGTALGDPIEIAGLTRALGATTQDRQFCAIGSVKSNIGHCESAAGIAGLTKVLLQIEHATLVPTLHAQRLNPNIDFSQTPFVVQRALAPWPAPTDANARPALRTAAVSSFGAGGSNAHVLVEEFRAPAHAALDEPASSGPALIVLSARDGERLQLSAERLLTRLSSGAYRDADLASIAYTLQVGREHHAHRLGLSARSLAELIDKLDAFIAGDREHCHCGELDQDPKEATALSAAEMRSLLGSGEGGRVLQAWVNGASCDWAGLHAGRRPRRLRLPTYPFARERYWAPDSISQLQRRPSQPPTSQPIATTVIADTAHVAYTGRVDSESIPTAAKLTPAAVATPIAQSAPVPTSAQAASKELRRIEEVLRETLAEALYMKVADVGLHTTFVDLGMDSVMGVEWLPVILDQLGVSLGATKIYEYPTIRDLATYIQSQRPAEVADEPAPVTLAPATLTPERSVDDWLQAVYDGSADPNDAQRWLDALDDASAGGVHAG